MRRAAGFLAAAVCLLPAPMLLVHLDVAAAPTCTGQFELVPSTDPGNGNNVLSSVAALTAADVWAVGYDVVQATMLGHTTITTNTLIEHWDGSSWSTVNGANLSNTPQLTTSYAGTLNGVAGSGPIDVWAVGSAGLIEHWNGTAWSTVASAGSSANLLGVWADSPTDAWIVGNSGGSSQQGFAEHWNGTVWSAVAGADAATTGWSSVSGSGPADVWAFGASTGGPNSLAAEHWDGTAWTSTPPNSNDVANSHGAPGAIVDAGSGVTVVGDYATPINGNSPGDTDFQKWNGAAWVVIRRMVANGPPDYVLNSAAASAPNDLWFAGSNGAASPIHNGVEMPPEPFVEHYDGTQFTDVSSVDPNTNSPPNGSSVPDGQYNGVAALPGQAWAVGYSVDPSTGNDTTLIETECPNPSAVLPEAPTVPLLLVGLVGGAAVVARRPTLANFGKSS